MFKEQAAALLAALMNIGEVRVNADGTIDEWDGTMWTTCARREQHAAANDVDIHACSTIVKTFYRLCQYQQSCNLQAKPVMFILHDHSAIIDGDAALDTNDIGIVTWNICPSWSLLAEAIVETVQPILDQDKRKRAMCQRCGGVTHRETLSEVWTHTLQMLDNNHRPVPFAKQRR